MPPRFSLWMQCEISGLDRSVGNVSHGIRLTRTLFSRLTWNSTAHLLTFEVSLDTFRVLCISSTPFNTNWLQPGWTHLGVNLAGSASLWRVSKLSLSYNSGMARPIVMTKNFWARSSLWKNSLWSSCVNVPITYRREISTFSHGIRIKRSLYRF